MNNYKLINQATKEEYLCSKITISGFDYYINDNEIKDKDWYTNGKYLYQADRHYTKAEKDKKVIATNNGNIEDLPKLIEFVQFDLEEENNQKLINEQNINKAIAKLEEGKVIYNRGDRFVAYKKEGKKYFRFTSENKNITETSKTKIIEHIRSYTLETNHYFF